MTNLQLINQQAAQQCAPNPHRSAHFFIIKILHFTSKCNHLLLFDKSINLAPLPTLYKQINLAIYNLPANPLTLLHFLFTFNGFGRFEPQKK
jgi:hypothetical protein